MPGVARIQTDLASAGVITGPGAPSVRVNNIIASVQGDGVAPHGETPHAAATIANGSTSVFFENRPATVQTISAASCSHQVTTGSIDVFIGR